MEKYVKINSREYKISNIIFGGVLTGALTSYVLYTLTGNEKLVDIGTTLGFAFSTYLIGLQASKSRFKRESDLSQADLEKRQSDLEKTVYKYFRK